MSCGLALKWRKKGLIGPAEDERNEWVREVHLPPRVTPNTETTTVKWCSVPQRKNQDTMRGSMRYSVPQMKRRHKALGEPTKI